MPRHYTKNINIKNCSLSIVLMATDQKPQRKTLKRYYYRLSHSLNVNVMVSNITFLMSFAAFHLSPLPAQFINSVNGDRSKTAKIIKKVILPIIASPEFQCDPEKYHLFNDFCCSSTVAINTMVKRQFLFFIFAVSSPNLCNASYFNSTQFNFFHFQV